MAQQMLLMRTLSCLLKVFSMKILFLLPALLSVAVAFAQPKSLGAFRHSADIGNPKNAGSAFYDSATQTYHLKGSGYNIWFARDEFRYLYNKMSGDFRLTGHFKFEGDSGNAHRKIGWMVRESEDESAVSMNAVLHGDGLVVLQWRGKTGAEMRDPEDEIFLPGKKLYEIIELERKGNIFTMRVGDKGQPLQLVGSHELKLPADVLAGLFICSHDENSIEEAKVWNVKIENKIKGKTRSLPIAKLSGGDR
jgi:TolB protein